MKKPFDVKLRLTYGPSNQFSFKIELKLTPLGKLSVATLLGLIFFVLNNLVIP